MQLRKFIFITLRTYHSFCGKCIVYILVCQTTLPRRARETLRGKSVYRAQCTQSSDVPTYHTLHCRDLKQQGKAGVAEEPGTVYQQIIEIYFNF